MKSNHLIFFLVICITPFNVLSSYIQSKADGNLQNRGKIHFWMFYDKTEGIIFDSFDDEDNDIILAVTKPKENKKYVCVKIKNMCKHISLRSLCGCDPCEDTLLHFMIVNDHVTCNYLYYHNSETWNTHDCSMCDIYNDNFKDKRTKMKVTGKTTIIIGNLYDSVTQVKGCMSLFYYNDIERTFTQSGNGILAKCPMSCANNICNGGTCLLNTYDLVCDCQYVSQNGRYCNKTLQMYNQSESKSYEIAKKGLPMYLKMAWQQTSNNKYCLVEILQRNISEVIYIHNRRLKYNNIEFGSVTETGINYVSIIKHNNIDKVMTHGGEIALKFPLDEITRINIGFSERSEICETFEGYYAIQFNSRNLQQIDSKPITKARTSSTQSTSTERQSPSTQSTLITSIAIQSTPVTLSTIINSSKETVQNTKTLVEKKQTHNFLIGNFNMSYTVAIIVGLTILLVVLVGLLSYRNHQSRRCDENTCGLGDSGCNISSNNLLYFWSSGDELSGPSSDNSNRPRMRTELPIRPTNAYIENDDGGIYNNVSYSLDYSTIDFYEHPTSPKSCVQKMLPKPPVEIDIEDDDVEVGNNVSFSPEYTEIDLCDEPTSSNSYVVNILSKSPVKIDKKPKEVDCGFEDDKFDIMNDSISNYLSISTGKRSASKNIKNRTVTPRKNEHVTSLVSNDSDEYVDPFPFIRQKFVNMIKTEKNICENNKRISENNEQKISTTSHSPYTSLHNSKLNSFTKSDSYNSNNNKE